MKVTSEKAGPYSKAHKKPTVTKMKTQSPKPEMTREDLEHYRLYGKWGYLRTCDCKVCGGTGAHENGNICDTCVCGSCAGEKHYCNGCDAADSDTEGAQFSDADKESANGSADLAEAKATDSTADTAEAQVAEGAADLNADVNATDVKKGGTEDTDADGSDEDVEESDIESKGSEEESNYSESESDDSDVSDDESDDHGFDVREFSFGGLFNYEYIDEDFGTDDDNTIIYHNVELLINIGFKKKGDVLGTVMLSAARGFITCDGEECTLVIA
jgi:hypothetical protein